MQMISESKIAVELDRHESQSYNINHLTVVFFILIKVTKA